MTSIITPPYDIVKHSMDHNSLGVNTVLVHTSTPVTIFGAAGATEKVVGTATFTPGVVKPDSLLRVSGLCNFQLPNNAGRVVILYINNTLVGQSFPGATLGGLHFTHDIYVLPDLSGVVTYAASFNDVVSPSNGQGAPYTAHTSVKTVSTIDLTSTITIELRITPVNNDIAELSAWTVENMATKSTPTVTTAPSTAVACWGDSLTAGTGASNVITTSYPGKLMTSLRQGKPIANLGVGGQTSSQIKSRVLLDTVRGRLWTCIFQMGRNDVGSGSLTTLVGGNIAASVANLVHTRYLVGSVISAVNEVSGNTNRTAIIACNTSLSGTYGTRYVDIMSTLLNGGTEIPISYRSATATTTGTWTTGTNTVVVTSPAGIVNGMYIFGVGIPDQTTITISGTTVTMSQNATTSGAGTAISFVSATEVHLNDTSYSLIASAYSTALAANGW